MSMTRSKREKKPTAPLPVKPEPEPVKPAVQPHYEWLVGVYEPVRYQRQRAFLQAALDYHAAQQEADHAAD